LIAGLWRGTENTHHVFTRLLAHGEPDPSFNSRSMEGQVHGITVQNDGRILVVGAFAVVSSSYRAGVARFEPDGQFDTGYAVEPLDAPCRNFAVPVERVYLFRQERAAKGTSRTQLLRRLPGPSEKGAPVLAPSPRTVVKTQHEALRIPVTVRGAAEIDYQWFFNGTPLPGQTNSVLNIPFPDFENM